MKMPKTLIFVRNNSFKNNLCTAHLHSLFDAARRRKKIFEEGKNVFAEEEEVWYMLGAEAQKNIMAS